MPSGYTDPIYQGKDISFREFAMRCSRAFGALVEYRDEPLDAEIPERIEPSHYSYEAWLEAKARLREVTSWSKQQAEDEARQAFEASQRSYQTQQVRKQALAKRYQAMLGQVIYWEPPSEDHDGLQRFMIDQLTQSLEYDCGFDFSEPQPETGEEYRERELQRAKRDIIYFSNSFVDEIHRSKERTEWLQMLRQSLDAQSSMIAQI